MLGWVFLSIALLCASAIAAAFFFRSDRIAVGIGVSARRLACVVGVLASAAALLDPSISSLKGAWPLPIGELHAGLDSLSAFFLLCIFVVSGLITVYGAGYLRACIGQRRLAPALIFFNLLIAAMAGLVIARDGI